MKKINLSKPTLYLSGSLVVILLSSGLFFKSILLPAKPQPETQKIEVLGENVIASPSPSPSIKPSASVKPSLKPSVKASAPPSASPSPSPSPAASAVSGSSSGSSPAVLGTSTSPSPSASPSSNPSPPAGGSPSPSPTPSIQTVSVEVQGSSFTLEISGDLNVCQVMQRARDQGKISSLTLDDSYMSSMNSQYVREMNGMSNNWTFKVNGSSPLGCSLYQVKPNDQIVWKFG